MRRRTAPPLAWLPRLVCLVLVLAPAVRLHAADPQPYVMTLRPTGDDGLDSALHDSSNLLSLQDTAPAGGFALVQRARDDLDRFTTVLHSFGFYKARVSLTIGGHPLDDPALLDAIDAAPAQPGLAVVALFDLGPPFRLGQVAIEGPVPPAAAAALNLTSGQPARAGDVLAAGDRLLEALRKAGYPLARVPTPVATLRPDDDRLDVMFQPDPGPQARLGTIAITGLTTVHEAFVRRRLLIHPGEAYSPAAIERARQDLASIGVFAAVRIEQADRLDTDGQLPLTVAVSERPPHTVSVGAAYSTDLGIDLTTAWHDRNLFGNAEQLNLKADASLGGNAETRPGYRLGAQFIKPDLLARDQALELDLDAVRQSLQAYDQTALIQKAAIRRRLTPHWTASLGLTGEQESIAQEDVTRHYNLIGLPVTLKYDSTTSLLDPTSGLRATLSVTPTESLGVRDATFVLMQAAASAYLNLSGDGRSVLALRGLVGQASGAGVFDLPPDQRFYAGGSATVRGFRYQSVGPQFADSRPTGGTAVSAASVEFRQRIAGHFGLAAFLDAGQLSDTGAPFTRAWQVGAGAGVRYYTAIGPLRLDVAMPLTRQPGGDSFELYIGLGQAF